MVRDTSSQGKIFIRVFRVIRGLASRYSGHPHVFLSFVFFVVPRLQSPCYNRSVHFHLTTREGVGIFPPSFSNHSNAKVCSRRDRGHGRRGGEPGGRS